MRTGGAGAIVAGGDQGRRNLGRGTGVVEEDLAAGLAVDGWKVSLALISRQVGYSLQVDQLVAMRLAKVAVDTHSNSSASEYPTDAPWIRGSWMDSRNR